MVANDRTADIVRPATIFEGSSSHALLDLQTDQVSALEDDPSLIAQARRKIELQKSKGFDFALIYMTADEKDASIEHDAFAELRDEGYGVYPGTTPDYSLFERGIAACEFTKIVWPRPALPDWALPASPKPKGKRKAAKQPRSPKPKQADVVAADTTVDIVNATSDVVAMTTKSTKKSKKRRDSSP